MDTITRQFPILVFLKPRRYELCVTYSLIQPEVWNLLWVITVHTCSLRRHQHVHLPTLEGLIQHVGCAPGLQG